MKYRLRPGWYAEVMSETQNGLCKIIVSVERPGRASHVLGVYHLALAAGQQPLDALLTACPQAFDLAHDESASA
jgi:hypothetical protein